MISPASLLIPFLSLFFVSNSLMLSAASPIKSNSTAETNESLQFVPPPGWRNADNTTLPGRVKLMVVGKGTNEFPPSIALATEDYTGTLKQYLKIIKELNASKGHEWRDLGTIQTGAGNASLSQTDSKSQWGDIRMMHVILKKNEILYIVTAAALKNEFSLYYKEIFSSLRSLKFSENEIQSNSM